MRYQSQYPILRRILRILLWGGIVCVSVLLIVAAYLFVPVISDPSSSFLPRKGSLQQVSVTRHWTTATAEFSEITLGSSSGLQVQLTVNRPRGSTLARPLVILMGGYRTGRHAAELIHDTHGIVIASLSYPYHGHEVVGGIDLLCNITAIRQAILDTPPVVLLALDYLAAQDYVDPTRIELAGVSFGAFLASIPGALDTRFSRVWLIHGSGDPVAVFDYMTANKIRSTSLRWLLTRGGAILIQANYLKPERWVGRISPRPVIVVNARNDNSFPRQSIESLHRALHQPYKIIWLGEEHVGVRSQELIQRIADLIAGYIFKKNTGAAK